MTALAARRVTGLQATGTLETELKVATEQLTEQKVAAGQVTELRAREQMTLVTELQAAVMIVMEV